MGERGRKVDGRKGKCREEGGRIKISRQGQVGMLFGLSRGSTTEQEELKWEEINLRRRRLEQLSFCLLLLTFKHA